MGPEPRQRQFGHITTKSKPMMHEADDDFTLEELMQVTNAIRPGGGFRLAKEPFRALEETEDARNVFKALGLDDRQLASRGPGKDPPDCTATIDGEQVGIEITELLDRGTLERRIKGDQRRHLWTRDEFLAALKAIINRKDHPTSIYGGPYSRYILVVRTDEFHLGLDNVQEFLVGVNFQCDLITEAYVAFGYHTTPAASEVHPYPVLPIPISKSAGL